MDVGTLYMYNTCPRYLLLNIMWLASKFVWAALYFNYRNQQKIERFETEPETEDFLNIHRK